MECSCEDALVAQDALDKLHVRESARRKHLDGVARKVKRAVDLCAEYCEFGLGKEGAELLARARTGNIGAIKDMFERVHRSQPDVWSFDEVEAVELALVAVEYLEYGLLSNGAPAAHH